MILSEVVRDSEVRDSETRPYNHIKFNYTKYGLVCHEWLHFFEKENFARLTIHQRDIVALRSLAVQRKQLVAHLWLRIELAEYTADES